MTAADPIKPPKPRSYWSLLRRREALCLTWRGWLLVCVLFLALFVGGLKTVHPFLALTKPVEPEVLVAEGWAADYALNEVVAELKRHPYRKLYVTGVPLEVGSVLSEYKTYAELGAARLQRMGLDTNQVRAVPAPWVRQDRTYTSAVALRDFFKEHGGVPTRLNLMTEGPHARRSWLMFRKAFGQGVTVGIISIPEREYDPAHWWKSSAGVRSTLDEIIAYFYARLFFHPQSEK
jgi:hypothetical protein